MEINQVKLYQNKHFYSRLDDLKQGIYSLFLVPEIEEWLNKNIKNEYIIYWEDYLSGLNHIIIMEFTKKEDAMAFKLRWC